MRAVLPVSVLLLAAALPAAAADMPAKPAAPPKSIFQQVVPHATGKNGYEELVLAAEAVKTSRAYDALQRWDSLPLPDRRSILADRNIARALNLLRQGLAKPIFQPREQMTFSTLLPELSPMRDLAKVLAIQQYVFLADGRVQDALAIARTGIRFGRVVQMDTLIAGLVGVAIEAITIQPLAQHLDQLSQRDTVTLYQICLEWLNQPNPQIGLLRAEQKWMRASMAEMADKLKKEGPGPLAKDFGVDDKMLEQYSAFIPKTPEGIDQLFAGVIKSYDSQMERVAAELQKPSWQRRKIDPDTPTDPASYLTSMLMPAYFQVDQSYQKEAARVQLLACHAAIRAYKWEHDRLPSSLDELRLGQLATDPFTGITFVYQVKGTRYSLTAAGSEATNPDDPRAVNGRVPVTLTPDD